MTFRECITYIHLQLYRTDISLRLTALVGRQKYSISVNSLTTKWFFTVDSRFLVKIANYGITYFTDPADLLPPVQSDDRREYKKLLWRAPELLRQTMPVIGTQVTLESSRVQF